MKPRILPLVGATLWMTAASLCSAQPPYTVLPPAGAEVPVQSVISTGWPAALPAPPLPAPPPASDASGSPAPQPSVQQMPGPPEDLLAVPPETITAEHGEFVVKPTPVLVKIWSSNFELGLNGAAGNSETFSMRFGAHGERKTDWQELTIDLTYLRSEADGVETANQMFLEGRNEWLTPGSPWSVYVHGTMEYDEFRAFDVRLTADTGLGYQLIKTDITSLKGRFGGGFSHEIGGPDDSIVPEGAFGLDFERKLSKRQTLTAKVDVYPDISDPSDYRVNSQADWQVILDEDYNLSLKLSVIDRYDSTPHGRKANDINYSALLVWAY